VSSINRADASPTGAATVRWTVTFSENVGGVDTADFTLVRSGGLTGGSITAVTPAGPARTYTVAAGTGAGDGTLRLDAVDNDSVRDAATNPLGGPGTGNGNATGQAYTIDRPPPTPTITQKPPDPTSSAVATFAWASQPATDVSRYECNKENGAWFTCSSPLTYTVAATNNGQHQFAVRAVDATGNVSGTASYKWKVTQVEGAPFQIRGDVTLYMGQTRPITVTLTNPNTVPIHVTALTVTLPADSTPPGCSSAANLALTQATGISASTPLTIPASSAVVLPAGQSPRITLVDRPDVNQDVCKNKTFGLTYGGSAHS
jgi:hypothetical protein